MLLTLLMITTSTFLTGLATTRWLLVLDSRFMYGRQRQAAFVHYLKHLQKPTLLHSSGVTMGLMLVWVFQQEKFKFGMWRIRLRCEACMAMSLVLVLCVSRGSSLIIIEIFLTPNSMEQAPAYNWCPERLDV